MHKNTSVSFDFTHLYTMVNNRTIGNTVPWVHFYPRMSSSTYNSYDIVILGLLTGTNRQAVHSANVTSSLGRTQSSTVS